jgi:uncharacterized membrane protein
MDKIVDKIAALGVPGLVLVVAMQVTGWAGAAALTAGLALLGGPFGMLGGIALLGVLALIAQGLATYGFEALFKAIVDELERKGESKFEIEREIESYPISQDLKQKIKDHLRSMD